MNIKQLDVNFFASDQVNLEDMSALLDQGFKSVICNRPDGEASDQPSCREIALAAGAAGLQFAAVPVVSGRIGAADHRAFASAMESLEQPVLAYCRTGTRSTTLWAHWQISTGHSSAAVLEVSRKAGYDLDKIFHKASQTDSLQARADYDILIVGAGAGGIAVASSIIKRCQGLRVGIVDPAEVHYYQPGWTLVGAGIFERGETVKTMASLIPTGVDWIQAAVTHFEPDDNKVVLENRRRLSYSRLVVAPGLKLDWHGVEGLVDTLGQNGVTSNYRFDLAPYTWQLVSRMRQGKAIFTQPPMPIKCAGAPQKALYLSADHWRRNGNLEQIDIEFCNAGAVLFGVKDYVQPLMRYIERYQARLSFNHTLKKIDGPSRTAWFEVTNGQGKVSTEQREFDFIHVCPPQTAPDFIRNSPLSGDSGWVEVDQNTLRHKTYSDIWSLGDVMSAPNAKTAAAARAQAPVVANNLLEDMGLIHGVCHYNGYGSCPLTVERGRILLAEFGYGGKLLPSFPSWLIDGTKPSALAWYLKEKILPPIYWKAMLKGREWMVRPEKQAAPEKPPSD